MSEDHRPLVTLFHISSIYYIIYIYGYGEKTAIRSVGRHRISFAVCSIYYFSRSIIAFFTRGELHFSQWGLPRTSASPSTHEGMGAIPYQEGIGFRVWAPHADKVSVTGTFNNWSKRTNPMAREGNGYWSADIAGAKISDQYRYIIVSGSEEFSRIDPYAREVTSYKIASQFYRTRPRRSEKRKSLYNQIL
jgi:hypothetical protein